MAVHQRKYRFSLRCIIPHAGRKIRYPAIYRRFDYGLRQLPLRLLQRCFGYFHTRLHRLDVNIRSIEIFGRDVILRKMTAASGFVIRFSQIGLRFCKLCLGIQHRNMERCLINSK
ncbi:hypothetical protein D3C86_1576930 [compost metagenome]